ncbi:MAG: hypothetical protein HFE83_11185 [Lachnospiraceae bacterium]|nr:hypothetical protein [Lachnospiraceae bacterium]
MTGVEGKEKSFLPLWMGQGKGRRRSDPGAYVAECAYVVLVDVYGGQDFSVCAVEGDGVGVVESGDSAEDRPFFRGEVVGGLFFAVEQDRYEVEAVVVSFEEQPHVYQMGVNGSMRG